MVRIVAGQATDSLVIGVIALAARQPVRLEAEVGDVQPAEQYNLLPRTVALPAKIGDLFRGQRRQIFHLHRLGTTGGHPGQMFPTWPMAAFTLDARGQRVGREFPS